jgi:hypothetical protein
MAVEDPASPKRMAQRSADRLALALEDVGFDVGQEFPTLRGEVGAGGEPFVEVGRVSRATAARLSVILTEAARHGVAHLVEEEG